MKGFKTRRVIQPRPVGVTIEWLIKVGHEKTGGNVNFGKLCWRDGDLIASYVHIGENRTLGMDGTPE